MDQDTLGVSPRLNLRKRLIVIAILVGVVPLLIATGASYWMARANLEVAAFEKLVAVRDSRASHVADTFQQVEAQVRDLARSPMTLDAAAELAQAFYELPGQLGWTGAGSPGEGERRRQEAARAVLEYYATTFADRFRAETGEDVDFEALVPTDEPALAAQYQYIAANPHGLGAKDLMIRPPGDQTAYGGYHADHHSDLRDFQTLFGFYDVILVDPGGTIVYTVGKEIDLGTNLKTGPHRDSSLGRVILRALASDREDAVFVADDVPYLPSYQAPAWFLVAPLRGEERDLGAVAVQMRVDLVNEVMTQSAGLGETGESYLVGPDRLMRSDSRFSDEPSILKTKVETEAVRDALAGNTGSASITDYRGVEVLSAWMPLSVMGLEYALIAEVDAAEALAPARKLFAWMAGLTLLLSLGAFGVAFRAGAAVAAPVGNVTARLEELAQHLLSESQEEQAGATQQSSAVEETRQTFQGLLEASGNMSRIGDDVLEHAQISHRNAETIGSRIHDLSAHAASITEVLTLVKEIANKSEILALNAALEGTKAGEAGRGFSLVAQQMQRLAEQVMGSVKKIESLTGDIGQASSGAVLAAEEAEKVSRLTTDSAREIAGAVNLQQSSAEQISVAMNEIGTVAHRNVEAARKIVTSSNELLSLAEGLRNMVGVKS
jgi:methyl-accepting chemotaxis protein